MLELCKETAVVGGWLSGEQAKVQRWLWWYVDNVLMALMGCGCRGLEREAKGSLGRMAGRQAGRKEGRVARKGHCEV